MRRGLLLLAFTLVALGVGSSIAQAGGGNSVYAKLCQKNGWQTLESSSGGTFANQSACVAYSANGGTLFAPQLTATDNGCVVPALPPAVGYLDEWKITATGFTPDSSLTISGAGTHWSFDANGASTNYFIANGPGETVTLTFTDGNGVSASVTFGPTISCAT
jgi:hypothetical protein